MKIHFEIVRSGLLFKTMIYRIVTTEGIVLCQSKPFKNRKIMEDVIAIIKNEAKHASTKYIGFSDKPYTKQ